jgi:protoporphyrinogen oxidase
MSQIDIVGAGPAGLMAAWRAARAGHSPVVHEAGSHVGGMAASVKVGGQSVDLGSHRLHPSTPPDLLAELRGLLGDDLQIRRRNGRIRLFNDWVAFPLRAADLARRLPIRLSVGIATDLVRRPFARLDGPSFADEVSSRLGPTVLDAFYGPYARKLYGLAPDQLDAEQARRRIAVGSPRDLVRKLLPGQGAGAGTFLYPRTGYGTIVERLADAATATGADIRLASPVEAIRTDRPTLFTAAPSVLAEVMRPQPDADVRTALDSQRVRSMVLVYLVVDCDHYTEFDAHYLPGPESVISRLSEPKNYRDGPDPPGRTVLCAEIPCWRDDAIWEGSDGALGARVVAEVESLGLPPVRLLETEVRRLPSVYPVYDLSGAAARALAREWVRSVPGVMVLGRQGLGVADNLHHVLAMGAAAASCVRPDGSIDRSRWRQALDRFEHHVVED